MNLKMSTSKIVLIVVLIVVLSSCSGFKQKATVFCPNKKIAAKFEISKNGEATCSVSVNDSIVIQSSKIPKKLA